MDASQPHREAHILVATGTDPNDGRDWVVLQLEERQALITPSQARIIAAHLLKLAGDIDGRGGLH